MWFQIRWTLIMVEQLLHVGIALVLGPIGHLRARLRGRDG